MAYNPELDYEYREGRQPEKQKPIIYQAHDSDIEPLEMATMLSTMQGGTWKSMLLKVCGGLAVLVLMGLFHNLITGL